MKSSSKKMKVVVGVILGFTLAISVIVASQSFAITSQKYLSAKAVLKLADNKYADGKVPLGDGKYVTDKAKQGYVYLCNARSDSNQGAGTDGPWIDSKSKVWNFLKKVSISGSVKWAQAKFSNTSTASIRTLSGNDLPIDHNTGTFPVAKTDAAYAYDRNPNTIKAQTEKKYELPLNPTYSETPYCMSGGEVGVMLSGVNLYNAFDAMLRDAPAHELQDDCDGHPQEQGAYHYHSMSSCFKNISVSTVLGFAFDGFPITGPLVAKDKYLTTEDLDECHGITSTITLDGKTVNMYHYVMTQDFPYSVSCFRGKPISYWDGGKQNTTTNSGTQPTGQTGQATGTPPAEAIAACKDKYKNSTCSFTTPDGKAMSGKCNATPSNVVACGPTNR